MNPLRVRGLVVALALAMTSTVPVLAQSSRAFPMLPHGADAQTGFPVLRPDAAAFGPLAQQSRVVLTGLLLPGGRTVDLDLRRLDLARLGFGFQVNGLPAPGLLSGLELSAWRGVVRGESGSEAVVSFSREGSFGWVASGGEIVHLLPRAGAGGDWSAYEVLLARETDLNAAGLSLGDFCGVDRLPPDARGELSAPKSPHVPAKAEGGPDCTVFECPMAIETDFQLFQQFGSLGAETTYVTTLLAAISARYEEQIDTVLTFPYVQFYTTSGDPWSSPDGGGGSIDMLNEFESAWAGSVPAGAVLGHFISGADLGGGVAYLGALCDTSQTITFAVSGNVDGDTPFPIAVSPLNWDFMVVAHETGHNFNAPHTHDYVPPIDNCAGGECITDGTIMSYCHTCPGGLENITTFFHPISVADMVAHASTCLPLQAPLVVDASAQPTLLPPGAATPLTVQVQGTPLGAVNLQYRLQPAGAFTAIPMASLGGGTYGADLPAAQCGQQPEWFFSMIDATCGLFETPVFTAEVGVSTVVFADAFETSTGWSTLGPGDDATTGTWTRADPNGTGAQPENDVSNPGTQCFFTGQGSPGGGSGDADIDGGQTTLTSPVLDLSSPGARIGYWRWYSNDTGSTPGTDVFVVDVSVNGSTWVNVETVGPSGPGTSGGWIYHEFAVADFIAPSATGRVRFIASDEGSGSLVEAAVDEFEVFEVDCAGVCQTDLGFGGPGTAVLSLCGGDLSPGNPADLSLTGATPNGTAWMLVGVVFAPTPAKGGTIVPVPPLLVQLQPLNGAGALGFPVGGVTGPLTVYLQYAYNLPSAPQGFGFSNALEVNIP
jgi:Metallo-peptidase family M12